MKLVNFTAESEAITIVPISDVHIGSPNCNLRKLKETIEMIRTTPHTYCVLLGDIIDNATTSSVGDTYTETLSPMQQISNAAKLFEPIKHKILAVTSGNHERRTYRLDGIDLTKFFCVSLNIQDVYDYASVVLLVTMPSHKIISLYLTHGDGAGGKLVGSKLNGLVKRSEVINADIYVAGHTHQPGVIKTAIFDVDKRHRTIVKNDRLFVNLPAYLGYETYAEIVGMPPSADHTPVIHIERNNNWATL